MYYISANICRLDNTPDQQNKTTEMKTLRCIVSKTLRDRVSSHQIREQCGKGYIIKFSRIKQKKWNEQINIIRRVTVQNIRFV